ncbi:MAG: cell division FtsZ family protein [Verrucomicrobia bacterium]|nr:cell division FtsZ family protein [Verrucomicrobiota bacterium]
MSNFFQDDTLFSGDIQENGLRIKIIGVGGGGNNAVDRLKLDNLDQVNLAIVNTDAKTLSSSPIQEKLMIGRGVTRGLSTGGEAELGRQAADSDRDALRKLVKGLDLVFILCGLGGGTGSGAAPVLAEVANAEGAVVVAFVTMPFNLEGARRIQQADTALASLRSSCHAVISLPNDVLLQQVDENSSLLEAFVIADEWINRGVNSICSLLFQNGLINIDFATLKRAFEARGGKTLFGFGYGAGEDAVTAALRDLEMCPLLHLPENRYVRRADYLVVNITGGPNMSMTQVNRIMEAVNEKFGSRDNTVMGAVVDGSMGHALSITVIGTTDVQKPGARNKYPSVQPAASTPANVARPITSTDKSTAKTSSLTQRKSFAEETALPLPVAGAQEEFLFSGDDEGRGLFDDTERNMYEGQDLDIPTFLRRGIKIQVHA